MNIIKSVFMKWISLFFGLIIIILSLLIIYVQLIMHLEFYPNILCLVLGTVFSFLISFLFIYVGLINYIEYNDEYLYIHLLWIKRKIIFSEVKSIINSMYKGGYWFILYDSKQIHIMLPFCKKQIEKLASEIKKYNMDFIISL